MQATSDAGPGSSPAPRLPFDLPESKPQRRVIRAGITGRSGVLARIEAAGPVPVIAVVAPAGDVTTFSRGSPFSHLALIEAGGRVILAGRIEELGS